MKRIGIVISKNSESGANMSHAWGSFISVFGIPVPIFALDEYIHDVDLLFIPGGADVDSKRYGAKPDWNAGNPNIQMEYFDLNILPKYIEKGIPIFAVCRGFQTLNVLCGGSLSQHIKQEYSPSNERDKEVHGLLPTGYSESFVQYFKLSNASKIVDKKQRLSAFRVNSLHHQGVRLNQLGKDIVPLFTHPIENNVEAFWIKNKPIVAVQWHPEETWDDFSMYVIQSLLSL